MDIQAKGQVPLSAGFLARRIVSGFQRTKDWTNRHQGAYLFNGARGKMIHQ
jgi:hypothetical protein